MEEANFQGWLFSSRSSHLGFCLRAVETSRPKTECEVEGAGGHFNKQFPTDPRGFPSGSAVKEFTCSAGDKGSIPGLGRSPGEGNGNFLQYSCLENPVDTGAWQATVHGVTKELDMTERLNNHNKGILGAQGATSDLSGLPPCWFSHHYLMKCVH